MNLPKFRFRLSSIFILMLGIALGFVLNTKAIQIWFAVPSEARKVSLQDYVIEPPDVVQIDATGNLTEQQQAIVGQHLVGPDGTINLATFGQVHYAGKTIDEAQQAVQQKVAKTNSLDSLTLGIMAYNSKVYYIVRKDANQGDNVVRMPITGNETVLDAIAGIGGLPDVTNTSIWISRPSENGLNAGEKLPVDWEGITTGASARTNFQLMPGDRIIISQKPNEERLK